ncbi:MAG: hypothetical protein JO115_18940 [Pseudonocardiales bacterium]|nr:hypothetical protein [Pseudonocardiales bacterium]
MARADADRDIAHQVNAVMVSPDALPLVLDQNTMRPAAAGLAPAITLERDENAGSCGHVAGRYWT